MTAVFSIKFHFHHQSGLISQSGPRGKQRTYTYCTATDPVDKTPVSVVVHTLRRDSLANFQSGGHWPVWHCAATGSRGFILVCVDVCFMLCVLISDFGCLAWSVDFIISLGCKWCGQSGQCWAQSSREGCVFFKVQPLEECVRQLRVRGVQKLPLSEAMQGAVVVVLLLLSCVSQTVCTIGLC